MTLKTFVCSCAFLMVASLSVGQSKISIDSITTFASRYYISQPDSAQYYLHAGIRLAIAQNNEYKHGIFLNKLITQKTKIRDYDSAQFYFKKAIAYHNSIDDKRGYPDAYSEMAETYMYMDKLDSSLINFKRADSLYASIKDGIGVLISKNNMAAINREMGNYEASIIDFLDAAKGADTTEYAFIKAQIYHNVATIFDDLGDAKKSIEYATISLKTAAEDGKYPSDVLAAQTLLARYAVRDSNYVLAKKYIDDAKNTIAKNNLQRLQHRVDLQESNLYVETGRYKEAVAIIEPALKDRGYGTLSNFQSFALKKRLAISYTELGQGAKAIPLYQELLNDAQKENRLDDMRSAYSGLARAYETVGNFKNALESQREFSKYSDSLLGNKQQEIIREAQVKFETERKEKDLAIARANLAESELKVKKKNTLIYGALGLAAILGLLGYLVYGQQRLKNKQMAKEAELKSALAKIETQNKLQEQRLRISRDLHDNIGSQLTFVTSSVDNLSFGLKDKDPTVTSKLAGISSFTKDTIHELRDTIWAMNKNQISLEDLQVRISNFIDKANSASNEIAFTFTMNQDVSKDLMLSSVKGMNLYRIIQESVNNALKYANAQKITVTITKPHDLLVVTINDNGSGFEVDRVAMGNGINNIKKRTADLQGTVQIDSKLAEGTTITLQCPIA